MGARSLAVLASATACLAAAVPATASARTLVVDDDGGCRDARYSTIQSAVDAAASGDVVRVCPGTYEELVSVATAGVRLVSATPHAALIKAPAASTGAQALVSLGARNVRLLDFTLSGPWPVAPSGNCAIDNAVAVVGSGQGGPATVIDGNRIVDADCTTPGDTTAILLDDADAQVTVSDNQVSGYSLGGLFQNVG